MKIRLKEYIIKKHPMFVADRLYYKKFNRHIDWDNPHDINEKINWLKFHADQKEWAILADKYAVRKFVQERGLSQLLVKLYGKFDSSQAVLDAWDELPEEFVLKSNNGCGRVIIVSKNKGGKYSIDKIGLKKELDSWLNETDYGVDSAELHYQLIKNCIISEELLVDESVKDFSRSLIDYKIWCFDGKPYGILVCYDRIIGTEHHILDWYDLDWNQRSDFMSDNFRRHYVEKPQGFSEMLEAAAILSKGYPQMRVDFYYVNDKVYFGELTFTSYGGYMDYFTDELLNKMGENVKLNLNSRTNEFDDKFYYQYKKIIDWLIERESEHFPGSSKGFKRN